METKMNRVSFAGSLGRSLAILVLGIGLVALGADGPGPALGQVNPKTATGVSAQSGANTISRSFALQASGRMTIDVQLPAPGRLEARAQWTGTAGTLFLILNGPGQTQAYARQDGKSPLLLIFDINAELLAKGKAWRLSIANPGTGAAQVQMTIKLPSPPGAGAKTQQARQAATTQTQTPKAATAKGTTATTLPSAAASSQVGGASQTQALSRLHKGPMVWSPVSQIQRPATEKGRPPYIGERVNITVPTKRAQIKTSLIKINKRQPLAFKAFDIADPQTGKAIAPETMLTLPNGKAMRASDYYEDLNILENEFNALGYTLDVRRDPSLSIKLQETQLSAAQAAQDNKNNQAFVSRHRRSAIATPLSAVEAHQQFLKLQSADKVRLQRLIKYRRQEPPLLSPSGYLPPPQPPQQSQVGNDFHYQYTTDLPALGDKDLFAIYLEGQVELSGKKPGVYAIPGTNAVQAGGSIELKASAEAGGYVFDNKFALIRIDGNAKAPSPGGEMSAKVTLYVAGMATQDLINCPAQSSPDTTKLVDLPHWDATKKWEDTLLDLSYSMPIPIGPFVINLTAGVRASAGVEGTIYLSPLGAGGSFGPYVRADVYASAGLNLLIVEVGVKVTLTLINNTLKIEGLLSLEGDLEVGESSLKIAYSLRFYDEFEALSGSLGLYVCIYVPAFDWPPWHKKCWDWDIVSWAGFKAQGDLIEPVTGSWNIFEGGAIGGPEAGSFKTTGSGGVTWNPDGMSCLLPLGDTAKGIFAPSVVEFNGQLHAFWLDGYTLQYTTFDPAVLTSVETKAGTGSHGGAAGGGGGSQYGTIKQKLGGADSGAINTPLMPGIILAWTAPVAVVFRNRIYLFHSGWPAVGGRPMDQSIYYRYMDSSGQWTPGAQSFSNQLVAASYFHSAAAVYKGELFLFFLQSGGKGIYYMRFRPGIMSGDHTSDIVLEETKLMPGKVAASTSPTACVFGDRLYVFHKGSGNNNIYYRYLDSSGKWGPEETDETKVEDSSTSDSPAVGIAGERIVLVYRRTNSSIYYRFGAMGAVSSSSPGGGAGGVSGQYGQKKQRLSGTDIVWEDEQQIKGNTQSDRGVTVCLAARNFFMFHTGKTDFKLLYKWFMGF